MAFRREQSKYIHVYEALKASISGEKSVSEKYLPPERELGRRFSVDRLTVRRALDLLVRDGLVRKQPGKGTLVLPSVEAPARNGVSRTAAFVLPRGTHRVDRITEPFNAKLFYLIEKELKLRGCHLLYTTVEEDERIPESIVHSGADGIIFTSQVPDRTLVQARGLDIPAVLINRVSDHFPMILEDRYHGFLAVLEHLAAAGHRNILFINGVAGHYTTETCAAAAADFTARNGDVKISTLPSCWDFDGGMAAMRQVLRQAGEPPTAVCACNDTVAIGAMEAAKQGGMAVPDRVSFVGFDDTEQCAQCVPRLSTVNVGSPLIARLAVEQLFSMMAGGNPGPVRTIVPTRLVLRDSIRNLQ